MYVSIINVRSGCAEALLTPITLYSSVYRQEHLRAVEHDTCDLGDAGLNEKYQYPTIELISEFEAQLHKMYALLSYVKTVAYGGGHGTECGFCTCSRIFISDESNNSRYDEYYIHSHTINNT